MSKFTGTITLDNGLIKDSHISSQAADRVAASKLEHRHKAGTSFNLAIGATPAAREEIVHVVEAAAASVAGFHCLLNETGTSTDVDFDLKKNGVSILSSAVNITHSDSDRAVSDGTISSTSLAAGDVISISLAVSSATGAQGPWAWVEINEKTS